jgi:hypothetical protein
MTEAGANLLHNPILNKGTAFTPEERARLKLRGLLPPTIETMDKQIRRVKEQVRHVASHFFSDITARQGPCESAKNPSLGLVRRTTTFDDVRYLSVRDHLHARTSCDTIWTVSSNLTELVQRLSAGTFPLCLFFVSLLPSPPALYDGSHAHYM